MSTIDYSTSDLTIANYRIELDPDPEFAPFFGMPRNPNSRDGKEFLALLDALDRDGLQKYFRENTWVCRSKRERLNRLHELCECQLRAFGLLGGAQ